jgi:hypothetical protein
LGTREAPDHAREGHEVQGIPVGSGERVADELRAGGELVAEGERDRQVGVEMDEVPRLVAQTAPHGGGDRDADQQHESGRRRDHAGELLDQPARLLEHAGPVGDRVAGGDQRGVGDEQPQHRVPGPAMPRRGARPARQHQQLDQCEVRAEQARQTPEAGQRVVVQPAAAHPERHHRRGVGRPQERAHASGS